MKTDSLSYLEQMQRIYKIAICLVLFGGAVLFLSIGVLAYHNSQPVSSSKVHCKDFSSYHDIVYAYDHGDRGLDEDNDGIPCENRK